MIRKTFLSALFFIFLFTLSAQNPFNNQKKANFQNPLFAGDSPDPSILRDGNDYYIVHSSFEYYPGLRIWHSTDLVH